MDPVSVPAPVSAYDPVSVRKVTGPEAAWRPGDVVLDADGNIRVRSTNPEWPWDYPNEGLTRARLGGPSVPDGGLEERQVPRPLILLVRGGQAVGGRRVEESAPV